MLQAACFGGMNGRIHAVMQERSSSLVDVGVGGASVRTACCPFRAEDAIVVTRITLFVLLNTEHIFAVSRRITQHSNGKCVYGYASMHIWTYTFNNRRMNKLIKE